MSPPPLLVALTVHVDDVLVIGSAADLDSLVRNLSSKFNLRDLGFPEQLLGISINRDEDDESIAYLSQPKMIKALLTRFGMTNCNTLSTPSDPSLKLEGIGSTTSTDALSATEKEE